MKTSSAAPPHRGPLKQLFARFRVHAKALASDRRGGIAIWMALGMPVVFGFAGLGLDVSSWYMDRRIMQSQVDAAAVEAAHALMAGVSLPKAVENSFERNNFEPDNPPEVNNPPASGPNADNALAVEVVLTRQGMLTFSSLFVSDSGVPIRARAVGAVVGTGNPVCVLALDGTLEFSGNGEASLNCGIASNSASSGAILLNGSAKVTADSAQAYGDITINGSAELASSEPAQANAPRIPDPYGPQGRNLQVPPMPKAADKPLTDGGHVTMFPGMYDNGLEIKKDSVTFKPGTYVIKDGDLNIQTHGVVTGDGVTFILTGTNPGVLNVTSDANIKLTAPSDPDGPYPGVLLFEDPKAPLGDEHTVLGGSLLELSGAIYTPRRGIKFSGGSKGPSQCLQIIARQVTVQGGGTIANDQTKCDALGTADMEQVRVKLIE